MHSCKPERGRCKKRHAALTMWSVDCHEVLHWCKAVKIHEGIYPYAVCRDGKELRYVAMILLIPLISFHEAIVLCLWAHGKVDSAAAKANVSAAET